MATFSSVSSLFSFPHVCFPFTSSIIFIGLFGGMITNHLQNSKLDSLRETLFR